MVKLSTSLAWRRIQCVLGAVAFLGVSTAGLAAAALAMADDNKLSSLAIGKWSFKMTSGNLDQNSICVRDQSKLLILKHGNMVCDTNFLRANANSMTYSYSCAGTAQGITTIRIEHSRLVHIHSQGVHNGAPYSFAAEGRHMSTSCR
ncbi:hypothetical protein LPB140_04985 [Sphingorhabdus lutea]|uniref:DUF3617 family protein n=1 Tax=Sphingorhabdus lutea TaxID=1913578 RepID=A0A1L3JAV1_9SPHN|nr:hypothetical protein [Sphingorhabdus lutea]APG62264.1 hypothetical protein LPB140_04985 [Sphingorhabdus lutea]